MVKINLLKLLPWILIAGLAVSLVFTATKMLQAQYDRSVAEANVRAEQATTLRWKTQAENAASLFQLQQKINEDSIVKLGTALGHAIETQELTLKALQSSELAFAAVQKSNEALVSMLDVLSPSGRPERLEVFVLDEDSVPIGEDSVYTELPIVGEIVVTLPADTELPAEIETVLTLLPFQITTALGCTPEMDAVALFETPPWVTATPNLGQVEPEVCHGPRPNLFMGLNVSLGNLAVGAGIGSLATLVTLLLVGAL